MWGTWWVWDARLTSELILLFLYIGYLALTAAIDDPRRADKAGGLLLLVGVSQHSDHLFFRKVVEHAASGLQRQPDQVGDGRNHAVGHAADGDVVLDVLDRRRLHARAHHHARTRAAHPTGSGPNWPTSGPGREMIHWNSFSDFLAMGGYGLYVWGSFGVTALIMAIEPIVVARNRKITVARLKRQLRAESRAGNRNTE
jgi:heme exporter protein D